MTQPIDSDLDALCEMMQKNIMSAIIKTPMTLEEITKELNRSLGSIGGGLYDPVRCQCASYDKKTGTASAILAIPRALYDMLINSGAEMPEGVPQGPYLVKCEYGKGK